jgi:hypothetical protein
MIEIALGVLVAAVIVLVAFGAFSYGLKCGKAMQGKIPPLVEPASNTAKQEIFQSNPFD